MRPGVVMLLAAVVVAAACARREAPPAPDLLEAVEARIPPVVEGWTADPERDARWDAETIYSYIDGHAEVYLAYGMRGCVSRTYLGPGGEGPAVVDVFRLASSADAWGVFRHDAEGQPVEVGQAARLRPGWLTAWQGPCAISVTADGEGVTDDVLVALGRAAAEAVGVSGPPPEVVASLPAAGLEVDSVRFVRHPLLLNAHLYLADEDLLGLAGDAAAAVARYRRPAGEAWLVVVEYPGEERAATAVARVLTDYLPEAEGGRPAAVEGGRWSAVDRRGERLALVVDAPSSEEAAGLLAEALRGGAR